MTVSASRKLTFWWYLSTLSSLKFNLFSSALFLLFFKPAVWNLPFSSLACDRITIVKLFTASQLLPFYYFCNSSEVVTKSINWLDLHKILATPIGECFLIDLICVDCRYILNITVFCLLLTVIHWCYIIFKQNLPILYIFIELLFKTSNSSNLISFIFKICTNRSSKLTIFFKSTTASKCKLLGIILPCRSSIFLTFLARFLIAW